jgi:hypothetical protein
MSNNIDPDCMYVQFKMPRELGRILIQVSREGGFGNGSYLTSLFVKSLSEDERGPFEYLLTPPLRLRAKKKSHRRKLPATTKLTDTPPETVDLPVRPRATKEGRRFPKRIEDMDPAIVEAIRAMHNRNPKNGPNIIAAYYRVPYRLVEQITDLTSEQLRAIKFGASENV